MWTVQIQYGIDYAMTEQQRSDERQRIRDAAWRFQGTVMRDVDEHGICVLKWYFKRKKDAEQARAHFVVMNYTGQLDDDKRLSVSEVWKIVDRTKGEHLK